MKYTAIIHGERIEIELNRTGGNSIEAEVGGRKYLLEARMVEPGVYWFNWNNRSLEISIARNGEEFVVSLADHRIPVEMVDGRTARLRSGLQGHDGVVEIRAPMPGKIVKLLVPEGAEIEANQGLLVMEAMKMQNEIKSPKKGIVRKLGVSENAAVNSGDLLGTIE
ncbi:MAG TPA: biotin/lipoyl-containing protein [Terriglobia bacterium]|nr:biotin/lipoyl-containing protein [Terriglobia bacterium]